jgi:hypothetical protein
MTLTSFRFLGIFIVPKVVHSSQGIFTYLKVVHGSQGIGQNIFELFLHALDLSCHAMSYILDL